MSLGSYVSQIALTSSILLVNKWLVRGKVSRTLVPRLLFTLGTLALLTWDLWASLHPQNYYTFFGIRTNYSAEELKRQKLSLSRQYHPDKSDSDGSEFGKVQELYELFNSPKSAHAQLIYDLYKVDLLTLYFDKLANTKLETFQVEKSNDIWIENYLILFLMLFCLKELKYHGKAFKIGFVVLLAAAVLPELSFYGVYQGVVTPGQIRAWVRTVAELGSFRMVEVMELWKRLAIAVFLASLTLYTNFIRRNKKRTFPETVGEAKELKAGEGDKARELAEVIGERNMKLEKRKKSLERTRTIFFIVIILYWVFTYFQII